MKYVEFGPWLQSELGCKVQKISVNAGMTCPNRDGTLGTGGCTFCNNQTFNPAYCRTEKSVTQQLEEGKQFFARKYPAMKYLAYFQAYTNTYAELDRLVSLYEEALCVPDVVGLVIGTRPDCMPDNLLDYLEELNRRTFLIVEYGVESANDETLLRINRGHTYADFVEGYTRLREASPRIHTCIHLIFGLPDESEEDMLDTVRAVAALHPHQVKIHLLHVLRGTALGELYGAGKYSPMEKDTYVETVVKALELLPPKTVIARLTGDGAAQDLLAPVWSRRKREVLNAIDKRLASLDTWQGRKYQQSI